MPTMDDASQSSGSRENDDAPLQRLLSSLPRPASRMFAWIRRPEARWLRLPTAVVLIGGGLLGFLPILGVWMLPVGAVLLAEDIQMLRRPTMRALGAVQGWWDWWRGTTGRRL